MKKIYLLILILSISAVQVKSQSDKITVSPMPEDPKDCFESISFNGVKKISKVCFPFVQMNFITKATYEARYENAAIHGGPKTEVSVQISNLDDEDFQELVDQLQILAEKKFKEGGYETIGYEELKNSKAYDKMLSVSEKPGVEQKIPALLQSSGATHLKSFTAKNGPVYSSKTGGMNLYKLGKEVGAGQVALVFSIDFSSYNVDKERTVHFAAGNKKEITKKVSIEAIPVISLNGELWMSDNGKFGGIRNKKGWGSVDDFVMESKEIGDASYELVVDKEAYKKAVLTLMENNLTLLISYLNDIRK